MDLDFKSVKALASPTRLEIINEVLDQEATTTKLADRMGKSKSTVSNHLKVLTESGLLEKDEEEGRRRVVYRPTDKARAIAEGKERKVKFSVVSSALTGIVGIFLLSRSFLPDQSLTGSSGDSAEAMGQMTMQSMEQAPRAAEASQTGTVEAALVVLGAGLIVTAVLALGYAYVLRQIRS
ncbi:ArsR/SmtB family transcription factor [Candidatus Nanosalina sp. VS9-1]|uniref:ArsR/SmtB family transcription factor n=1 Tax=Candidatus Nanosalina sp. VS9-1 TaxID=3388566 RepID=UPI0039E07E1A